MIQILLIIGMAWASPVTDLNPTIVEADEPTEFYPRSVKWPIVSEKLSPRTSLPVFEDSLNSTGELQARFQGSPTISIRGSGQSGRVLALFNNVPLNFATGFGPPEVLLPREILNSISVAKGPTSVFYGSQAMGGSVHFVPEKVRGSEFRLGISDTDDSYLPWRQGRLAHHNLTLLTPLRRKGKNYSQASFFTENDDGQFPFEANGQQGLRTNNSSQTNRATLIGQESFGKMQLAYDLIAGNLFRVNPGPTNFNVVTNQKIRGLLASVAPSVKLTESNLLRSRISYIENHADYLEPGNDAYYNQETTIIQNEFQQEVGRYSFQVFADYFAHRLDASVYNDDLTQDQFELATMASAYLTPIFYLQAGTRYLVGFDQLISSIGITHTPYPFKVWLNFSEGYRNPTVIDLSVTTPQAVANPGLQPESSHQYELGLAYEPVKQNLTTYKPHFSAELRFFYMEYSNFIETIPVGLTGQTQKVNRGEGHSQGIDSRWAFSWGPWVWNLNYNYLDSENKQLGQPFRLAPEHQLSWSIDHFIGAFQLRVQNVLWQKTFDRDLAGNLQPLPDWNQWNLELHTFALQKWNFSLGVLNLFDTSKQLTLNYPEPQRRYWARIRYKF